MTIHYTRLGAAVWLCLAAMLSSYGCDDANGKTADRGNPLRPSPITFTGFGGSPTNSIDFFSRGITLQPASVIPQRLRGATCPIGSAFVAPFRIVAEGNGRSDLFLSQVQMRFTDRAGVFGEPITIGRPQLVELFGSTRIPPLGSRVFPMSLPFGCIGQPVGTATVIVFLGDSSGREEHTTVTLFVG